MPVVPLSYPPVHALDVPCHKTLTVLRKHKKAHAVPRASKKAAMMGTTMHIMTGQLSYQSLSEETLSFSGGARVLGAVGGASLQLYETED